MTGRTLAYLVVILLQACSSSNAPLADARPVDVTVDRGADQGVDALAVDLSADLASADSAPDAPRDMADAMDLPATDVLTHDLPAADMLTPDVLAADAGPACGGGTPLQTFSAEMVLCGGPKKAQCEAITLCGGWSLCTATQYRARGGETTPALAEAWLASCIRNGGGLKAATDAICGSCKGGVASMATTSWECDGSADTATSAARVGVATHGTCHRVGSNSATREAFWIAKPVDLTLTAAACCRP